MPGQKREAAVVLSKTNGDFPLLWLVLHTSCSLEPPPGRWLRARLLTVDCGGWRPGKQQSAPGSSVTAFLPNPAPSSLRLGLRLRHRCPLPPGHLRVGPATLRPPATLPPSTSNCRQPPRLVPSSKTGPSGSRLVRPSLPRLRASPAPCLSPLPPAGQQPAGHTRDARYRSPSPASPVIWFCFRCFVLVIVLAAELRTAQHTQASSAPHPQCPKPAGASISNLCRESRPPSSFLPSLLLPGLARKLSYSHLDPT